MCFAKANECSDVALNFNKEKKAKPRTAMHPIYPSGG